MKRKYLSIYLSKFILLSLYLSQFILFYLSIYLSIWRCTYVTVSVAENGFGNWSSNPK